MGGSESSPLVRYHLLLSESTLGELWLGRLASGVETGRLVTIRRFSPDWLEPQQLSTIQGSRSWYARLRHPTIAKLLHVSVTADELLCISEYLEGVQLVDLRRDAIDNQAPIPQKVAVRMVLDVARAACAAQRLINPPELVAPERLLYSAGVCVTSFGEALLGDVGVLGHLARTRQARQDPTLVVELAPEEFLSGQSSERAEVFTLGVLLWELLANRWLFDRKNLASARDTLCSRPIPELGSLPRDGLPVPAPVQDLVAKATRRAPSERFANVTALSQALEELPDEVVASTAEVADFVSSIAASKFSEHRMSTRWSTRVESEGVNSAATLRSDFEPKIGHNWEPPTLSERRFVVADVKPPCLSAPSDGQECELATPPQRSMIVASASRNCVITVPPVAGFASPPLQDQARKIKRFWVAISVLFAILAMTLLMLRSSRQPTTPTVDKASRQPHPAPGSSPLLTSKSANFPARNADFGVAAKPTVSPNGPGVATGSASRLEAEQIPSRAASVADRATAGKQPAPSAPSSDSNPAGSIHSKAAQSRHGTSSFRPKGI